MGLSKTKKKHKFTLEQLKIITALDRINADLVFIRSILEEKEARS